VALGPDVDAGAGALTGRAGAGAGAGAAALVFVGVIDTGRLRVGVTMGMRNPLAQEHRARTSLGAGVECERPISAVIPVHSCAVAPRSGYRRLQEMRWDAGVVARIAGQWFP